jgi:uncharacterized repeat protein (TIGR03803 family)
MKRLFLFFAGFCILLTSILHAAGSLKVTLTPAQAVTAGAQWRVDNGAWNKSGATVNSLIPGSHFVDFKSVAGWITPSPYTLGVTNGKTTAATANYVQSASLKITLTPSSAQWKVDSGPWTVSGATVNNLTPGTHTVTYQSLSGYQSPPTETLGLTAGQTLTLARSYIQLAQLTLTLNPTTAQWRVDGGSWRNSGTTAVDLSPGSHGVDYSSVPGFTSPPSEVFNLSAGQSLSQQRNYIQLAQITVTLDPTTGSWQIDGGPWQPSGATVSNLAPGAHTLTYVELDGYDPLPNENVSLSEGQTASISRSYVPTPPPFAVVKTFDDPGYFPYLIKGRDGVFYGVTNIGGGYNGGTVFRINADGTGYAVLRTFHETPSDAYGPTSIVEGSDGLLYGCANFGGTPTSAGVVFSIAKDGSNYRNIRAFTVSSEGLSPNTLMEASDGMLYGTSLTGGLNNRGVVFKLSKDGNVYSVIRNLDTFSEGKYARTLVQGSGGTLYGTYGSTPTAGSGGGIYKINTDGTGFVVVKTFGGSLSPDGSNPRAPLYCASDGFFYGTASSGGSVNRGTVFRINPDGTGFVVIKAFAADGSEGSVPASPLCEDDTGVLYGTCGSGGAFQIGLGTLYKLARDGTGFAVLKNFTATDGYVPLTCPLLAVNGAIVGGTTRGGGSDHGTLFKVQADGNGYTVLKHFGAPNGSLTLTPVTEGTSGVLYGSTRSGGVSNEGTLYKVNTDGSEFQVLYPFSKTVQGSVTQSVLVGSDGYLYSPSTELFRLNPDGTGRTVLHHFNGSPDGESPSALIEGSDGVLYGTTILGGSTSSGTVFRINRDGSGYNIIHDFSVSEPEGQGAYGKLTEGSDGFLYGTTYFGGGNGGGTVFRVSKTGDTYTVLRNFSLSTDGGNPFSGVTLGTDGMLYGVTSTGGPNSLGTIYRLNTDGSNFTVLHAFPETSTDGSKPYYGGLVEYNGVLYGTTAEGGTFSQGTIYMLRKDGTGYSVLVNLGADPAEGVAPNATLLLGKDGNLYGSCGYGRYGSTVFRLRVK